MDNVQYITTQDASLNLIQGDYDQFAFQRHYHLDYHIGLITDGGQKFVYKGAQHRVGKNELVIIPPDEMHDGQSLREGGYKVNVFCIAPDWFTNTFELSGVRSESLSFNNLVIQDTDIFAPLQQLHHRLKNPSISSLAKDCLPFEGFEPLVTRYTKARLSPINRIGNQPFKTLKDYMMENLDQPIRLSTLAELCQLSTIQLQRHFKAQIGMTPYAWLARLRLEQSMKLLQGGEAPLSVAMKVGFYDQAHFSKAFKKAYRVSPSFFM